MENGDYVLIVLIYLMDNFICFNSLKWHQILEVDFADICVIEKCFKVHFSLAKFIPKFVLFLNFNCASRFWLKLLCRYINSHNFFENFICVWIINVHRVFSRRHKLCINKGTFHLFFQVSVALRNIPNNLRILNHDSRAQDGQYTVMDKFKVFFQLKVFLIEDHFDKICETFWGLSAQDRGILVRLKHLESSPLGHSPKNYRSLKSLGININAFFQLLIEHGHIKIKILLEHILLLKAIDPLEIIVNIINVDIDHNILQFIDINGLTVQLLPLISLLKVPLIQNVKPDFFEYELLVAHKPS
jgi:hypothetical protein